jgi:phage FluMu protein Com
MINNFEDMEQFRCPTCSKLLFKYKLRGNLEVQIKCIRCRTIAALVIDRR